MNVIFKSALSAVVIVLLILPLSAQETSNDIRMSQVFNFGWKFKAGDVANAQAKDFNDSAWRALDLPHDFQIEQPWDESASRARGFKTMSIGW